MIYFDNSATTKPYQEVLDSFTKVSLQYFGNPSSLHRLGGQAEKLLNQARAQVSQLLHVETNEVYFTSGGTEGNNIAIRGAAFAHMNRGRHIITTEIEHASVKETYKQLQENGYEITYIPVDSNGIVDVSKLEAAIREDTILVSVMHVNNEVGSIQPIKEIGTLLTHYPKILFHVDNIQGIGKVPLSIRECHIDLYTISAHKFHGLKGTGVLYVRNGIVLTPLFTGGGQEQRLRSGTENVAGMVALAKALRITLEKQEMESQALDEVRHYIHAQLALIKGIVIHTSPRHSAPHIINFSITGFKAELFVHAMEEKDIFVSTTSACSSKKNKGSSTLLAMGKEEAEASSAIRISLSYENTMSEAKQFIAVVKETVNRLGKVMNVNGI